ncbi:helix-turn-helix domain-containing protein [Pelagibacterium luteolum]|uniref:Helix-turn-helix domain-containing protein n=1 Tax=Pelagibacterium luteolum TaxID=440168 RepID=A0A1G7TK14_9HYPH|nr:Helix-turn-helix domain-containing protein [Pelagibacterium luteolum]
MLRTPQKKPCPTCGGSGEIAIHIGDRIADLRKKAGLTQQDLADKLPVTRPQLANIECGRGEPSMSTLQALCMALEIDADTLLFGGEE